MRARQSWFLVDTDQSLNFNLHLGVKYNPEFSAHRSPPATIPRFMARFLKQT